MNACMWHPAWHLTSEPVVLWSTVPIQAVCLAHALGHAEKSKHQGPNISCVCAKSTVPLPQSQTQAPNGFKLETGVT